MTDDRSKTLTQVRTNHEVATKPLPPLPSATKSVPAIPPHRTDAASKPLPAVPPHNTEASTKPLPPLPKDVQPKRSSEKLIETSSPAKPNTFWFVNSFYHY